MVLQHRMLQAQASCSMETLDTLLRIPNVTQHPNSDWAMCFAPEKMVSLNTPQCGGDQFIIGLIVVDRLHGDDVENRPVVIYNSIRTIIVQCDFGRVFTSLCLLLVIITRLEPQVLLPLTGLFDGTVIMDLIPLWSSFYSWFKCS